MLALFSTKSFSAENNAAILTPLSFYFILYYFYLFIFCSSIFSSYPSDEIEAIIQRHHPYNHTSMKKYTHAWLAFMAMKRLELAAIPQEHLANAQWLVKWFKDYRDFVISGSWYPDDVFKDMATSHIIKYRPDEKSNNVSFRKMPSTLRCYQLGLKSPLYQKPFTIEAGNLADRCEAFAQSIVDSFKMLRTEDKGNPISPSNNHIATRFFILSHYIADCHMPLHCDARSFSMGANIHAFIESEWDKQVRASYELDKDNKRFFYDPQGYPLKKKMTDLMTAVEQEIVERPFKYEWGSGCKNTWDYMSGVSQYSYLMSYRMIPAEYDNTNLSKDTFRELDCWKEFDNYSKDIFSDAVESIARVWLHVWARYRQWAKM